MRDAACQARDWGEDDVATTRSEASGESDGSDESMWAATTEDTIAREFQSAIEIEPAREMVSLRCIHERLALESTRSAFWEILAKELLVEAGPATVKDHARLDDETGARSIFEPRDAPETSDVHCETLKGIMRQMQTLESNLDSLKGRAAKDQHTISALREEVKRTDRLKNGYKRQVKDLKALLESSAAPTTAHAHSYGRHDVVDLQRKLAEMRVLMEGLRQERDSAQARADVVQGQHDELKQRFARREYALTSAQRRCRDLEEALSRGDNRESGQKPSDEDTADPMERCILVDAGTCMTATHSNGDSVDVVQDDDVVAQDDGGVVVLKDGRLLEQDVDVDEDEEPQDAGGRDDTTVDTAVNEELALADNCAESSLATFISQASPAYRRIFGDTHDLDGAANVLIAADDVLAQCTSKILQLTNELNATRDELHGLKCQCAEQYDRAFKYKTMCSSLATKVGRLEAHIATAKRSADEYRHQMEHLVQRQREAAAEESHRLEGEIQALSQEQARLLLKLHAVQGDLAKSRALNVELGRPLDETR